MKTYLAIIAMCCSVSISIATADTSKEPKMPARQINEKSLLARVTARPQNPDEHVVWNKTPINFVVPVGKERMLSFPSRVVLRNNNPDLTSDKVSILNNAGTLYIRAKKAFSPIRVEIVDKKTGEVILVDLSAKQNVDDAPLDVVMASQKSLNYSQSDVAPKKPTASINYVTLTRYAVQQLYAPKRLLTQPENINRSPMYSHKSVNIFYGDQVTAFPLISWRGGDLYVTAVLLKNQLTHGISLDPRALIGNWRAASFYPTSHLARRGNRHDSTTLFVVSASPFGDTLGQNREFVR